MGTYSLLLGMPTEADMVKIILGLRISMGTDIVKILFWGLGMPKGIDIIKIILGFLKTATTKFTI